MPTVAKRATCSACLRPQRTCLCDLAVPVEHATQVLILQHPLEVREAKGTARLLHRCLPYSRIEIGEHFDAGVLRALLYDAWPEKPDEKDLRRTPPSIHPLLLYPQSDADFGVHDATAIVDTSSDAASRVRLIVLDGTWRKSRKMLHCNPLLAMLPRLSLAPTQASRHLIRKAHRPGQLSTLEAACYALMQLEQDCERFQPILHALDEFVVRQSQCTLAAGPAAS